QRDTTANEYRLFGCNRFAFQRDAHANGVATANRHRAIWLHAVVCSSAVQFMGGLPTYWISSQKKTMSRTCRPMVFFWLSPPHTFRWRCLRPLAFTPAVTALGQRRQQCCHCSQQIERRG